MKPIDIASLRALWAASTPGTWVRNAGAIKATTFDALSSTLAAVRLIDDAAFIVAAHAETPKLLDEIESLREAHRRAITPFVMTVDDTNSAVVAVAFQQKERTEKAEAEVESLRTEVARLKGLIDTEVLTDMHYCETHEMAFQSPISAPVNCPYCEVTRLRWFMTPGARDEMDAFDKARLKEKAGE